MTWGFRKRRRSRWSREAADDATQHPGEQTTKTAVGLIPRLSATVERVTGQSAHVHMEPAEQVG
jgi:hypothetical protein